MRRTTDAGGSSRVFAARTGRLRHWRQGARSHDLRCGGVTDGADRSVRLLTSSSSGSPVAARPGSVAVAIGLFASPACCCSRASRRPTRDSDPARSVTVSRASAETSPTDLHRDRRSLLTTWVETYDDPNQNRIEDADEHGVAWFYWLVDPGPVAA
jgi:hypothetical protein